MARAGNFALLSYDVAIILMEKLHSEADVRSVACTCKYLRGVSDDGLLWRVLVLVQTYVFWNFHRPLRTSNTTWTGRADLRHFVQLAGQQGQPGQEMYPLQMGVSRN